MSVSLSTFTDVSLIDSSASGGTVVLPRAGGIRYRVVIFKDRKGTFQNNPLTLNTLPGDIFEDGTTTKVFRDRFTQVWLYSDGINVWHVLSGTQIAAMTVSSMTVSSIRGDGSLLTNINAISSLTLQSTLQGLGTLGYVSTASLLSTTAGLLVQIQTSGAISTPNLVSTVAGLGSAGYASTSFVGNAISTFSTALGPGGGINLLNLQSTVAGLGSATYLSSAQLLSTTASYARAFQTLSASVSSLTASNVYASTLNVDNLIIGTGLGFINIGPLQATAISTIQVNTNALYANSNYFGTTSSQTALQFYGLTGSFSNTVIAEQSTGTGTQELLLYKVSSSADRIRLQTTGSIVFEPGVSARLWPSAPSNATPAMVIDTASNVGIGTAAPGSLLDVVGQGRFLTVSTQALWTSSINGTVPLNPTQLISTVAGLGSALYVSTASLVSTTASLQNQIQTSGAISTPNLISTVAGLGSAGYASTTFVGNAISTFSSALGPVLYLSSLQSTVAGLGSASYISTASLISTTIGIQSQIQNSGALSTPSLLSTVAGLGSAGYASTSFVGNAISTFSTALGLPVYLSNLQSTVAGLGSASYVSTATLFSTTTGLFNYVSTFIDPVELTSTIVGLGSANFISTIGLQQRLQSTVEGLGSAGYASTSFVGNAISTFSTALGPGDIYLPALVSTVAGLGTAGYASTSFVGNAISTFSTALGPGGGVSQANLTSTVQGLGSANYISSSQLISTVAGLASGTGTPGFPSTVSTSYSIAFNTSSLTTSTINFVNIPPSSSNLWVAVGVDTTNTIKYSFTGRGWTNSVSGAFATSGNDVAYNGSIWVAVGSGGNSNSNIKYSVDGLNWLDSLSGGFFFNGYSVAWNGRMWVATGNDLTAAARVKYSYDGRNWSNSTGSAFTSDGADAAWNGYMWVAVGSLSGGNSNETIKYSYDGISWSNSSGIGFNQAGYYAASAVAWNGSLWIAVGFDSGNGTIKYSVNGINWSNSLSGGFTSNGQGIAWNGQMWVAAGTGSSSNENLKYSFNGLNWLNSRGAGFTSNGNSVAWDGNLWVASGSTSSGSVLKYSIDGINWSDSGFNTFTVGRGVAFSSNTRPSYNQNNLSILPQNIPIFITSTNTILAQPSSLVINNTLEIDGTWNRIGINCNTPAYSLDIAGSLNTSSFFINTSSFTNILTSTVAGIPTGLTAANLASTVQGLGSAGYASTSFVGNAISTFSTALGPGGGVSLANLTSTVQGLGSASYVSSSQLISTVAGLASGTGTPGFPSTVSTSYGASFNTSSLTTSTINFVNIPPSRLNLLVAVGSDSTQNNSIKYSFDGITWTNSSGSGFTAAGYGIAWNGRIWVAVGNDSTQNNTIKYSGNGINWSNSSGNGFLLSGRGVAWNGRLWVAVGNNDVTIAGTLKYSSDGINWTNSASGGFDTQGTGIAWNGSMWVAVGQDSTANNTIKYSYDGINWSNSSGSGFTVLGWGIAWNGRMWVATGIDGTANNRIKYSFDGINWSNSLGASFSGNGRGIAWNGTLWVAVGIDSTAANTIKYSGDGITWSNSIGTGFNNGGWGIAWNGRSWIAVGDDSTANNRIKYSLDGITWSNSSGSGFSLQGFGVGFTSNLTPAYQQVNLSILPQNIPIFLTSTNTILAQASSLVINNTIDIDATVNRVGINTNQPQYSLDIAGSLNTSSFFINTSSFTNILTSTVAGIGTGGSGVSQTVLTSTVIGLGTIGYISTPGGGGGIQTSNLTSTVQGLGSAGYASTSQSQYSLFTVRSGTSYTGEPWTEQLMSLSNLGVFNAPVFLESDNITLRVSTTTNMLLRVSYMTGGNNNTLTTPRPTITMALSTPTEVSYFPSVENFEGGGGSVSFIQNFDAASRLLFYMRGLSNYTFGTIDANLYRMTFELVGQTQVINVLSNISSISSIINNLYTQNTRVTTEFIVERSSITTSAFAVDMTARNANIQNSTTTFSMFADTTRTLNSSISRAVHTDYLRVMSNAIIGCNSVVIRDDTVFASSVQVSTINILDQSTMRFVPLSISSGSIYLNNVLASAGGGGGGGGGGGTGGSTLSSLFVGSSSNQNFIKFWGSIGEYNNTAIVQQSTGGGTNEFLFFEGSTINDQIRFQTTGNIRFEAGVPGPRDVNTAVQALTPTMIINSSSNVGINTGNPSFNLDVGGSGRFQTLMSTVQVFSGALYLGVFFA